MNWKCVFNSIASCVLVFAASCTLGPEEGAFEESVFEEGVFEEERFVDEQGLFDVEEETVIVDNEEIGLNATTRTCTAEIDFGRVGFSPWIKDEGYDFRATRGCGSKSPDKCRERARGALNDCFRALNNNVNDSLPTECHTNGVSGYQVGSMRQAAVRVLCPAFNGTFEVATQLRTFYGGNNTGSCSSSPRKQYSSHFTISCP